MCAGWCTAKSDANASFTSEGSATARFSAPAHSVGASTAATPAAPPAPAPLAPFAVAFAIVSCSAAPPPGAVKSSTFEKSCIDPAGGIVGAAASMAKCCDPNLFKKVAAPCAAARDWTAGAGFAGAVRAPPARSESDGGCSFASPSRCSGANGGADASPLPRRGFSLLLASPRDGGCRRTGAWPGSVARSSSIATLSSGGAPPTRAAYSDLAASTIAFGSGGVGRLARSTSRASRSVGGGPPCCSVYSFFASSTTL